MEYFRKEDAENKEMEIAYSRSVKAGKRIYYLDVKRSRADELYLSLTESKKKVSGDPANPDVTYEKHKIFLYREDLARFTEALIDVIRYMQDHDTSTEYPDLDEELLTDGLSEALSEADAGPMADDGPAIRLNLDDFE